MADAENTTPDPAVTSREAGVVTQSLLVLSRDPAFRSITRLFDARRVEGRAVDLLKTAVLNEIWGVIKRDARL